MGAETRTRQRLAVEVADEHGGVATRALLRAAGLSTGVIRAEVSAGRWTQLGIHTLGITGQQPQGAGRWWWAVWESGPGAVLDGLTALEVAGLRGWDEAVLHVTVPSANRVHRLDGVRVHRLADPGPVLRAGVPRTRPEVAVVRAALWSATDRQAATVVAMTMQQRLAHPDRVLTAWDGVRRCARREILAQVLADVCDGAHSLHELDFARMCRERGLPEPTRQVVRHGRRGRIYLDVGWEDLGVHVEIDGAQHGQGLASVDDAIRHNDLELEGSVNLRIPVLGLRLQPDVFMDQVAAALASRAEACTQPEQHAQASP